MALLVGMCKMDFEPFGLLVAMLVQELIDQTPLCHKPPSLHNKSSNLDIQISTQHMLARAWFFPSKGWLYCGLVTQLWVQS